MALGCNVISIIDSSLMPLNPMPKPHPYIIPKGTSENTSLSGIKFPQGLKDPMIRYLGSGYSSSITDVYLKGSYMIVRTRYVGLR